MNSMNMSYDSMKQNKNIEECEYEFDMPQQTKTPQQKKPQNKKPYNKNNKQRQQKKEPVHSVLNELDEFFKDMKEDSFVETNSDKDEKKSSNQIIDKQESKQDNKQVNNKPNQSETKPSGKISNERDEARRERERQARLKREENQRKQRPEDFERRKLAEIERERKIAEEEKARKEQERNEDAKQRFMEADKKIKERETKNDISENKEEKRDMPEKKKQEQFKTLIETEEEGKYNIVADNSETIEDINIVLFNKKIISDIREKIKEEGVDVLSLPESNMMPIVRIVKNPRQSFRKVFGKPVTFIVTGYKNDGHTERIYIEVIDAPKYIDKEDEEKSIDVKSIIQAVVRNEQLNQDENYQISIVLSKNTKAEPIKDIRKVELKEMFAIDGVVAGLYIDPETNKKRIETNNEFPPSIIRHSYQYCNDILNGTAEKYPGGLGGYFRRQLKVNTAREAEVLEAEIVYVAQKQELKVNLEILDALEHFHFQRRGENDF